MYIHPLVTASNSSFQRRSVLNEMSFQFLQKIHAFPPFIAVIFAFTLDYKVPMCIPFFWVGLIILILRLFTPAQHKLLSVIAALQAFQLGSINFLIGFLKLCFNFQSNVRSFFII